MNKNHCHNTAMRINNRGFVHHHYFLGFIIICGFLIGGWYVLKSYQENRLKENLGIIVNDYKSWTAMDKLRSKFDSMFSKDAKSIPSQNGGH